MIFGTIVMFSIWVM